MTHPTVWVVRGWGQVLDVSLREVDAVGSANPAPTVTECVAVPVAEWERVQADAARLGALAYAMEETRSFRGFIQSGIWSADVLPRVGGQQATASGYDPIAALLAACRAMRAIDAERAE